MAGINLWYDLDEDDSDCDKDDELYEKEDLERELAEIEIDDEDIICPECGVIIEDGFQCQECGFMVGI
jgi:hypothetical protein